jgi:hypothetical protein
MDTFHNFNKNSLEAQRPNTTQDDD